MTPVDETVAAMVAALSDDLYELWNERAGVREHDGGQSRELAEAMALIDVIRICPAEAMACWANT
ncbi:hypothetical protein PFX98_04700 [Paucibacter sediminis]|uniref:Uncharacterized protein n=1 Tax=Paucibacter sediminis TaxID=3019553 RepID=A0AA95ND86_9BURK|nr:hypothetical protein [Paucibacter sp. S2-9]WIT12912.1 hypothetical protein PFX98_04700 [Paucibacter sp. S2-9]